MKYIISILLILSVVGASIAKARPPIGERRLKVSLHRKGYAQPPNYHKSRQLPIRGGAIGDYSQGPKGSVKSFPALKYIQRPSALQRR